MPRKKIYNDEDTVAFSIRLPVSLREKIESVAYENHRSVNQEIVTRLEKSLQQISQDPFEAKKESSH